jgi:BlaI family transcriptional regulator, penicillinase repressor
MARRQSPALTDAEARLMTALWSLGEGSVAEVAAAVRSKRPVNYSTVQTILRILEAKGYVSHRKAGRAFIYRPEIDQRQARRKALSHLLTRLFDDSPSLLVLNVLEDKGIEARELARLKKLLETHQE